MKRFRLTFLALASFALLATSCGGGGGGGSDYDDARPVAESGSAGSGSSASGSASSGSSSGSESAGGSGSTSTSPSAPEGFVLVQGATFDGTTGITGMTASDVFIEGRTVTIPNLWVCDHEVTQAEYESVMLYNPSQFKNNPANGETQENRPVESVSWYDAIMYCNKRSADDGRTPCYKVNGNADTSQWGYTPHDGNWLSGTITCDFNANGYRLPTEAEWEYLARGGNLTNDEQTAWSGNEHVIYVAWYKSNSENETHEVKKKRKNSLDLYDMSGNVWEWCWDWWHESIDSNTPFDGGDVSGSTDRVCRGGYWFDFEYGCTVYDRQHKHPWECPYGAGGFRLVCSRSE